MFAIGLGKKVTVTGASTAPAGDTLLRYVGSVGDDGDPGTDACASVAMNTSGYSCGNYYFVQNGSELSSVFEAIASRVYTRLTK